LLLLQIAEEPTRRSRKKSMPASSPVSARLQQAVAAHQCGNIPEAQLLYQAILELSPHDADALHLLGVTFFQQGVFDTALKLIAKSIEINPQNCLAYTNIGNVFQSMARHQDAINCYDCALSIDPGHADAFFNRGIALHSAQRDSDALTSYDQAIALNPAYAEAHHLRGNLLHLLKRPMEALTSFELAIAARPEFLDALISQGLVLQSMGRSEEALTSCNSALKVDPASAQIFNNRGLVLQSLGRENDALASYEDALLADTDFIEAHFNRGNSLFALGRFETALNSFEHALALRPAYAEAHNNKGNLLHQLHRDAEALTSYDQAISLKPDYEQAFFNRGIALQFLDRNQEASASYARAIRIKPDYTEALNNQGNTFQSLDLYQNALKAYLQAQTLDPDYADAHWNEALCRLKIGDFENGWKKYEWRWQNSISNPAKQLFTRPLWGGKENLKGKTILLHSEQGLGDTIQFFRYAGMVARLGAITALQVHPSLATLLQNRSENVQILSITDASQYDFHCPLLSLPLAFKTKLWAIPASDAYLFSDPGLSIIWRKKLGVKSSPRVGLVWSGNPQNANDQARSTTLSHFVKLLRDDIQWFSLQKEISAAEQKLLQLHGISHFGDELNSFSETAALIEQMDVVISVDTAVAHLAAALGKPTWVLLAHNADFRWLLGRCDSPWYPSVQLFRQPGIGDWTSVFSQLAQHMAFYFDTNFAVELSTERF
jgi:tetratricopeptide (TPR) repeat protein